MLVDDRRPVPAGTTRVLLAARTHAPAHLGAFLLTATGTRHDDTDFVFGAKRAAPGVRSLDSEPGMFSALELDLGRVPTEITTVRVVLGLDNPHGTFDGETVVIEASDDRGSIAHSYKLFDLGDVSALIALDIERVENRWQIVDRGRGHAGGFIGLMAQHHVFLDGHPVHVQPPTEAVVDISRSLELDPGQTIRLRTGTGESLDHVRMSVGWDPLSTVDAAARIDLDSAALLFDHRHQLLDVVYFAQLSSKDGSVRHLGDDLTGHGAGDGEIITADLARIHDQVATVVLIVTSYGGHSFDTVGNAHCHLFDSVRGAELAHFDLAGGGRHTGLVLGKLYRTRSGWKLQAIGDPIIATHPGEALPHLTKYLA
ncbi:TerD family protein [Nocardia sp. NPDC005978]|uniref:TerD family protein n=1 Tax=Nocardia sp. NPDC005978 TaxID=3156725 RepID=UPI0033A2A10E